MHSAPDKPPLDRPVYMRSKYGGVCPACTEMFAAGDRIVWFQQRGAVHYECHRRDALSVVGGKAQRAPRQRRPSSWRRTTGFVRISRCVQERGRSQRRLEALERARRSITTLERELEDARDLSRIYARAQAAVAIAHALAAAARFTGHGKDLTALRGSLLELC